MHNENNGQYPGYVPPTHPNPPQSHEPHMHVDVNAPAAVPVSTPGGQPHPVQAQAQQQPVHPGYATAPVPTPQPTSASPVPPSGGYVPPSDAGMPQPEPPSKKKGSTIVLIVIAVLLVLGLGGWLIASITGYFVPAMEKADDAAFNAGEKIEEVIDAPNQDLDKNLANVVAETAMPSIATIYTYATPDKASNYYDILDMMLGNGRAAVEETVSEPVMTGLGSGVIIRDDGYIITNNHVVDGAEKLMVNIGDDSFEGTLVGTDPSSDIAVVKIEPGDVKLDKIEIADSNNLSIGDWVMALGAPLGYEQSATTGIISALGRDSVMEDGNGGMTIYANMIQTDAAINSGNSGGALVDDEAKLVGINTLVAADSTGMGQADNLGFAIPSTYAIAIANQLIDNNGKVSHAKLGVSLDVDEEADGAVVALVSEGSSAEQAGLEEGDVIVAINGQKIASPEDVVFDIRASQPGDKVKITVDRNGQTQDVVVVLGNDNVNDSPQAQGNGKLIAPRK